MSTQNMDSNPQQAFPSLCSNGCGFFSTTDKEGLCSVCFKEKIKKEAESSSPPTTSSSTQTPPTPGTSAPSAPSAPSSESRSPAPPASSTSTSTTTPDLQETTTLSESVLETSRNVVNSEELASSASSSASDGIEKPQFSPRKTPHPVEDDQDPIPAKKPKKNRCVSCKKKLGLTGFTCRCGGQFCSLHRYSDKHDCPFDYKAMGEQEISQNNPQVVAQKVAKL